MLKIIFLTCLTVNLMVDSFPLDDTVIEEHIIGGNDTDISKVPYQIAMYDGTNYVCGGFIVSPSYVVTAAHCIHEQRANKTSIRAGSSSNKEGGVVVKVKTIIPHPKFNLFTADYDIAILELETPLKFTDKIKSVKLATKEPAGGSPVLVSGWGAINEGGDKSKTLQSITVPIYERTTCETAYAIINKPITARMICAGVEGKRTYMGDSGGPAVYKGEVVGVVSFGAVCQKEYLPDVYANIVNSKISKFIRETAKL